MEFYSHQQQQQQAQQQQQSSVEVGVMSGAAAINSTAATTLTTTVNSSVSSSSSSNLSQQSSSSTPPTAIVTPLSNAPDAVTVDIAKNMLQLHRGGAPLNNNNSSNNNNNSSAEAMSAPSAASTVVVHAAANSSSAQHASPLITSSAAANTTTHPPATQQASLSSSNNNNNTSSGASGDGHTVTSTPPANALGYLKYDQELLYITDLITIIGRNSSSSHVHFHVAENNLVSRKHFQIVYDPDMREFYVQCLSKNGIFVDDFLHRRNAESLKLPDRCYFRFPSTEIRIQFESFLHGGSNASSGLNSGTGSLSYHSNNNHHSTVGGVSTGGNLTTGANNSGAHVIISPAPQDDYHAQPPQQQAHGHHHQSQQQQQQQHSHAVVTQNASATGAHLLPVDNANVYSPLKISIPKKEQKSPYLSPTGTISAANSCPASPRQGFHQNQTNYNNYGNNNLQNQDLFQTPSTASYNHNEKPPYSYAQLIVQAISAAPDKQLTLSGIYSFIVKHYPYYRKETNKGWQNSIRHNLSLNRYFIKVARSQDEPGKGSFWRIDPDSGAKLIDHSYKKRRQRSSQGFRPSYGMPRSAPVSPSHMDNSRESSPLPDYVLQSAPGSPGMSMENRAAENAELMYNPPNVHQQAANNSHNQYNSSSPYFVSNQNSVIGLSGGQPQQQPQSHTENNSAGGGGGGNGVGALIALKRNHAIAANANAMGHQQQAPQQQQQQQASQQQQPQPLHPDIIYEDMPTDYSGNMESGDECDPSKRPKYMSEVL